MQLCSFNIYPQHYVIKYLKGKKWIHSGEQVLKREVAFVENSNDAIAEICLVDEDKDGDIITLDGDKKVCY